MDFAIVYYQNRIDYLKYRDQVSNAKKQVNNKNLIAKAARKMRKAQSGT